MRTSHSPHTTDFSAVERAALKKASKNAALEPSEALEARFGLLDGRGSLDAKRPPRPTEKPAGFMAKIARFAGRRLVVGGVAAVMLAASVGQLSDTSSPTVGAPIEIVQGSEVSKLATSFSRIAEVLAPLGIEGEDVWKSLRSVTLSAVVDQGHHREIDDAVSVDVEPGARFEVRVSEHGLRASLNPGLHRVVDWGLDSRINSVSYNFHNAEFSADAEGLFSDASHSNGVAEAATARIAHLLPQAMRVPGYTPSKDPNVEANLQRIVDLLRPSGAVSGATMSAPSIAMSFQLPDAVALDLPDSEYTAHFEAGTWIRLSVDFEGPTDDVRLSSLGMNFSKDVAISKGDKESLVRMDLENLRIGKGGEVDLRYSLGAEQAIDGIKALAVLTATLANPLRARTATISSTRLEKYRNDISTLVDEKVEPALEDLIAANDLSIDGVSLKKIFGTD